MDPDDLADLVPPARGLYTLDAAGEKPVPCDDVLKWARWYSSARQRWVERTALNHGRIMVSTIFLGLDHGRPWAEFPPAPVLWETMVFRQNADGIYGSPLESDRCTGNREQALAMHAAMCARLDYGCNYRGPVTWINGDSL